VEEQAALQNKARQASSLQKVKSLEGRLKDLEKQEFQAMKGQLDQDFKVEDREVRFGQDMSKLGYQRGTSMMGIQMRESLKRAAQEEGYGPEIGEILVKLENKEELSREEQRKIMGTRQGAELYLEAKRARTGASAVENIDDRDYRKVSREMAAMNIPNALRIPEFGRDPKDKAATQELLRARRELATVINKINESVKKNGIALWGKAAGEQGALAGQLQSAMRKFSGVGANLTAPEIPYLRNLLAMVPGTEDMTEVIKEQLFKGGVQNRLNTLMNVFNETTAEVGFTYGYVLPESGWYSPETRETIASLYGEDVFEQAKLNPSKRRGQFSMRPVNRGERRSPSESPTTLKKYSVKDLQKRYSPQEIEVFRQQGRVLDE
jgi:hypothetical protein